MPKITDLERGFRQGVAMAISYMVYQRDVPSEAAELAIECDITPAKLRAIGMSEYDMRAIEKVAREPRYRRAKKRKGRSE